MLDPTAKPMQLLEKLYLLSKEASGRAEIDQYWRRRQATSRYVIAQLLLDPGMLRVLRRRLRQLFAGVKIDEQELGELLKSEIVKRDVLEGDKAGAAVAMLRRAGRRRERAKAVEPTALAGTRTDADLVAPISKAPLVVSPPPEPS